MPLDPNIAATSLQFVEAMGHPQMWEGTPEAAQRGDPHTDGVEMRRPGGPG